MAELKSEKLAVLPKRHETSFIAAFNTNIAGVGQSNTSAQGMLIGVFALQASGQRNTAIVAQHN